METVEAEYEGLMRRARTIQDRALAAEWNRDATAFLARQGVTPDTSRRDMSAEVLVRWRFLMDAGETIAMSVDAAEYQEPVTPDPQD